MYAFLISLRSEFFKTGKTLAFLSAILFPLVLNSLCFSLGWDIGLKNVCCRVVGPLTPLTYVRDTANCDDVAKNSRRNKGTEERNCSIASLLNLHAFMTVSFHPGSSKQSTQVSSLCDAMPLHCILYAFSKLHNTMLNAPRETI